MSKEPDSSYRSAFRFLFLLIKPHRKWYITAATVSTTLIGVNLLQTYTTQQLIDSSIAGNSSRTLTAIAAFLLIVAVKVSLTWLSSISMGKLSALCGRDMKQHIAGRLIKAEYSHVLKLSSGDTLNTLNSDTSAVTSFLSGDLITVFSQFAMAAAGLIYLIAINPLLCAVTFAYSPIGIFFTMTLNRKMNQLYPHYADSKGEALSLTEQVLCCIPVIKSFVMEKQYRKKAENAWGKVYKNEMGLEVYNAWMQPACSSVARFPVLIYLLFAGSMVMNGRLSIGTFLAVYSLLEYIIGPSVMLPFMLNGLNRSIASINRIKKLGSLPERLVTEISRCGIQKPSILVSDVSFSYQDNPVIFSGISLQMDHPGIVALKGGSGSGKTTLLDLVCGLYAPNTGSIRVCGLDPAVTDISSLISVVTQDTYLFPVSIRENIKLSRPAAGEDEIKAAARLAGADEFITQLENGYETIVGDGGDGLSGGQKQRIALAQAILKDTPVWLLDEPTSALDSETEVLVIDTIKQAAKEKIILVSAHRKVFFEIADQIVTIGQDGNQESPVSADELTAASNEEEVPEWAY